MSRVLHITNGESANGALAKAGISGTFLAWDDVMHEGVVPGTDDLATLSRFRATFIANRYGLCPDETLSRFLQRDAVLSGFTDFEEVVLWNSHELFDQLHMLQLFAWFYRNRDPRTVLSVVFVADLLGCMALERFPALMDSRNAVTPAQLALSHKGWKAFRATEPESLYRFYTDDPGILPFLKKGLRRFFEEFPDARVGLSRTERQILTALRERGSEVTQLFRRVQAMEDPPFMGDSSFWSILKHLANCAHPPLAVAGNQVFRTPWECERVEAFRGQRMVLTEFGDDLLSGGANMVKINGINRALGGVSLRARDCWFWESPEEGFVRRSHNGASSGP